MISFIPYIAKVVIISAIMVGYYWVVLRNKKFHHFNRFYLMAAIVLPIALPFVNIGFLFPDQQDPLPVFMSSGLLMDNIAVDVVKESFWDTDAILNGLYLIVAGICLVLFFISLLRIFRLSHEKPCIRTHGIVLINTEADGTPFSFFNRVFWNPEVDMKSNEGIKMLEHELTHCRQLHSLDKIFVKIVCCIFWFNPIFWLVRNEIYLVHEFLADKISFQTDSASFSKIILEGIYPGYKWQLTNSFFYSPIKRRIMMLLKNNHQKVNYIGRLMVLPLAAGLFIFFTIRANAKQEISDPIVPNTDTIPLKEITSAEIRQMVIVTDNKGNKDTLTMEEAKEAGIGIPPAPPAPPAPPSAVKDVTTPPAPANPPSTNLPQQAPAPPVPPAPATLESLPADALYLLDGKEVDQQIIKNLPSDQVRTISVIKGKNAELVYGDKAKHGVIEIFTKSNPVNYHLVSGNDAGVSFQNDTIPKGMDKVFTSVEKEAQFPGGKEAWSKYVKKVIQDHIDELEEKDFGTCVVKFLVDKNGNVSDVKTTTMKGTKLAEIAVDAIRKGPKWIPAQQNGRYVNAYRMIPLTLSNPNNK